MHIFPNGCSRLGSHLFEVPEGTFLYIGLGVCKKRGSAFKKAHQVLGTSLFVQEYLCAFLEVHPSDVLHTLINNKTLSSHRYRVMGTKRRNRHLPGKISIVLASPRKQWLSQEKKTCEKILTAWGGKLPTT